MQDITKIDKPEKGQVAFMHFLSPKSYRDYRATGERYSHNDSSADDSAVDEMMKSMERSVFVGKLFLSMYAVTFETYNAVVANSGAYGQLYRAFVLDPAKIAKHNVVVFNGDVQNLAQSGKTPSSVLFVGDEASTSNAILDWQCSLAPRARRRFFSEARLYGPLTPAFEKEEYGYPGSDFELANAIDESMEDEDIDL